MPIKFNLTKYDSIATKIKKVSTKKKLEDLTDEERKIVTKAILIASFASGHSWQTYKTVTSPTYEALNTREIKNEYLEAKQNKWKSINTSDIGDFSSTEISDRVFSEWLIYNVDKGDHDHYKGVWSELKTELQEDCDIV